MATTANGYDMCWVDAINRVLEDRGADFTLHDIDEPMWDRFLGPLIDEIQAAVTNGMMRELVVYDDECFYCGTQHVRKQDRMHHYPFTNCRERAIELGGAQ